MVMRKSSGVNLRASPRSCAILLALTGCGGDFELPPQFASSEYIVYHTNVDASVICMDDLLAREDRFIEHTAALLGVEVPSHPIDFVWDPINDGSEPWACPEGAPACHFSREGDDLSVIVSEGLAQPHELVHAIEIQALGHGHPTLSEGLAEYLGAPRAVPSEATFPELFKAMLAKSAEPANYSLAMFFVGSIFARHGATKYRELHARMPASATLERFAEVFEAVYGQSLDDALREMSGGTVEGLLPFPGCAEGEAREIPWTSEGLLDAVIEGSCGDPWFAGGGFSDGKAGFRGYYIIEVPKPGYYDLTVTGGPLVGIVAGCSFALLQSAVGSKNGQTGRNLLEPGRHTLAIAFPPGPEARGEAKVRLAYVGPPP